jgi:DNA-directed RNA polymerase subunit RPC12/RpoP
MDKQDTKQEQGEPVGEAYLCEKCQTPFDGAWKCPSCGHNTSIKEPVYTTPQQRTWVGLNWSDLPNEWVGKPAFMEGAKWAERKLEEKNT